MAVKMDQTVVIPGKWVAVSERLTVMDPRWSRDSCRSHLYNPITHTDTLHFLITTRQKKQTHGRWPAAARPRLRSQEVRGSKSQRRRVKMRSIKLVHDRARGTSYGFFWGPFSFWSTAGAGRREGENRQRSLGKSRVRKITTCWFFFFFHLPSLQWRTCHCVAETLRVPEYHRSCHAQKYLI